MNAGPSLPQLLLYSVVSISFSYSFLPFSELSVGLGSPFTHFRLCPYQVHWENNHLFRRDEFIEAQCFFFRWILPRARGRIGRISLAFLPIVESLITITLIEFRNNVGSNHFLHRYLHIMLCNLFFPSKTICYRYSIRIH